MHGNTLRMSLYSSIAILTLVLAWGLRQIPATGRLAEEALKASVDQELIVLNGAVKSSTQALKYRLLDILKVEGGEHSSRPFQDSPFLAAGLLESDQSQWKMLWYSVKSKTELQSEQVGELIKTWPLAKLGPDEVLFVKVADIQGQAFFAVVVPVRKANQIPMLGVGIFPAAEFGLFLSADQAREIQVYDSQGFALALSHPAYLGTSLKSQALVRDMLESEEVRAQREWKNEAGRRVFALASRVSGSNLTVSIEAPLQVGSVWWLQGWFYLLLCAAGACALNWYLFSGLLRPLLDQLSQTEELNEQLRRQIHMRPELTNAPLRHLDFKESEPTPAPPLEKSEEPSPAIVPAETPPPRGPLELSKIVQASLRSFQAKMREMKVNVVNLGLEEVRVQADPLQLQTAIEEIVKNSIEAMAETSVRNLTLSANQLGESVHLSIEDSGEGIADGHLAQVFDPFFSTRDAEGVSRGLGLNVARRVIEEMHGTIKITSHQSPEGSGTRVTLEWPTGERIGEASVAPPSAAPTPSLAQTATKNWPEIEIRRPRVRTLD